MAVDISNGIMRQNDVRETVTNTEETNVAWNMNFARFEGSFESTDVMSLFIHPEGTKMFVANKADDIIEYALSIPWDVTSATVSHTLDVSAKEDFLTGVYFKPDGTKMYIIGTTNDKIFEYDLSTPWLLSSAVFLQEFLVSAKETSPTGLFFREDGQQFYIVGTGSNNVHSYFMSVPWDITTAQILDELALTAPVGVYLSRDGRYLFHGHLKTVKRFTLSSVYRVSSGVLDNTLTLFPEVDGVGDVFWSENGTKMYVIDIAAPRKIFQYTIKRGFR